MRHLNFFVMSSLFQEVEQRVCQVFHRLILCKISVLPAADTLDQLRVHRMIEFVCASDTGWQPFFHGFPASQRECL